MKDIPGFEGRYAVTKDGRVWSHKRNGTDGRWLRFFQDKRGYLRTSLVTNSRPKHFMVHRLVAITFLGKRFDLKFVNHKNGVKTDNRVGNLEWCTMLHNRRHAIKTGLWTCFGQNHYRSKLTVEQVVELRALRSKGWKLVALGARYGISHTAVSYILRRKTWKSVD